MTELSLKLFGNDSCKLRGILDSDEEVFSTYDFITTMCEYKDDGGGARKEFKRLTRDGSEFKDEITSQLRYVRFPNQRGPLTPAMTIGGLSSLLIIMGSKVAAEYRALVNEVFSRVKTGDTSLIEVIKMNAASNAPFQQLCRKSQALNPIASSAGQVSETSSEIVRKRQSDREDTLFDLDVAERKQKLAILVSESQNKAAEAQMKAADAQMKVMGVQKMLIESYALLCPNQVMDDRARLLFKDNFLNIATQSVPARGPQLAIASDPQLAIRDNSNNNNNAPAANVNKPITISTLAAELGYRFDAGQLQKIGKRVASAYREKYGECPGKHEQMVGQASILVNSYTERDRGLVEKVILEFINE